jgi:hypothetical protein
VREVRHARTAHKEQEGPVEALGEALGVRRARADQTKAERAQERAEERT